MKKRRAALITGGAGFIGSHVADELLRRGCRVRALDSLRPQVHGSDARRPPYLDDRVDLQVADVRDATAVRRALDGIDVVVHLAAAVGVGQSMYEISDYTGANALATSVLLEQLIEHPVDRLVVASSMSIYGEGRYIDGLGRIYDGVSRSVEQLREGRWEPEVTDSATGRAVHLEPAPTAEDKPPALTSVYALSKHDQERLCLLVGEAYDIPTVALRFFNTYGPRQALSNPYTGVLAIFAARLLNDRPPVIFEDGEQRRDFVSVHDVARACCLAVESDSAVGAALNVGSGTSHTVREVAATLATVLGRRIAPEIAGRFRLGDVRHCYADITRGRFLLGYEPEVDLESGLAELGEWLEKSDRPDDRVDHAREELERRGLSL